MTAGDATRFYTFSPPGDRANFSLFWGISLVKPEENGANPLEKIRKICGNNVPKLQISVPCCGRTYPDTHIQHKHLLVRALSMQFEFNYKIDVI